MLGHETGAGVCAYRSSFKPIIDSGNTNAPCIMIDEKVAGPAHTGLSEAGCWLVQLEKIYFECIIDSLN